MRVYKDLEKVETAPVGGRAVAIGVFDGVHLGHQLIIKNATAAGRTLGTRSTVVTFAPHPDALLRPRSAPRVLVSPQRKLELLGALGIQDVVLLRFDRDFARLSPEEFCRVVLSDRLNTRIVFVGEGFRFGSGGEGTAADLSGFGQEHGFAVQSVPLVELEGETVSSTRIRRLLGRGEVARAARLLGRPHRVEGVVTGGAGRGRVLRAPTANIVIPRETALPRLGVYVTRAVVSNASSHPAVTSVGTNPTFEAGNKVHVETLLLGFEGDLYGSHLSLDFLERIRGQRRFADAQGLREQIARDVEEATEIHRRLDTQV